ncbi:MAG: PilC/PilY family type IV pilus protein [Polyangiales bacterium]
MRGVLTHQRSPDPTDTVGRSISGRPTVVYAASNDGIVHAFLAQDYPDGSAPPGFECVNNLDAGAELWGFVPPMFLSHAKDLLDGRVIMTDGNLQVKEMYDYRAFPTNGPPVTNVWRTVLFAGFRQGGAGAFALDITNPCKPEFLWQFADTDLGLTFGEPTGAQILLENSNFERQVRGVVLLPGGRGGASTGSSGTITSDLPQYPFIASSEITPRSVRRSWPSGAGSGRALYFIDLLTGRLIKKIDGSVFNAPLSGGISVFNGNTGSIGSRAFLADEDGVLWRIDFSDPDVDEWDAHAFYDMYHGAAYDAAQPSYNGPAITVDPDGNVVVIQATGNVDLLDEATVKNRVASLAEQITFDDSGITTEVDGFVYWELDNDNTKDAYLDLGEQITGPIELFAGNVYFGSFQSNTDPTNACPLGGSRLWGLNYTGDGNGDPEGRLTKTVAGDVQTVTNLDRNDLPELQNSLLMGVRVERVLSCVEEIATPASFGDPYMNSMPTTLPKPTSAPKFQLVAQLSGAKTGTGGASVREFKNDSAINLTQFTQIVDYVGPID